jgi:rare lipoprotein A (peptidoglycan hydrolase)
MDRRGITFALAFAAAGFLLGGTSLALASSGGVSTGEQEASSADSSYQMVSFGARNLRRGNRGDDVKTLNWLLRAERFKTGFDGDFLGPTDKAVRAFQARVGHRRTGVVKKGTRKAIAKRMDIAPATWYGPGFYGNRTACGKTLKKTTIGVAHKKLPCGTRVVFAYNGRWVRAKVIDRGPYNGGYRWDLTRRLAKKLGFLYSSQGRLRVAKAGK